MFLFFIHNYADIIDMNNIFLDFAKQNLVSLELIKKLDNIPRNNTNTHFVKKI